VGGEIWGILEKRTKKSYRGLRSLPEKTENIHFSPERECRRKPEDNRGGHKIIPSDGKDFTERLEGKNQGRSAHRGEESIQKKDSALQTKGGNNSSIIHHGRIRTSSSSEKHGNQRKRGACP